MAPVTVEESSKSMPSSPDTMTLEEVAQRLGTTVPIVRRATRAGSLPALKLRGRWFILRRPFERMMDRDLEPTTRQSMA